MKNLYLSKLLFASVILSLLIVFTGCSKEEEYINDIDTKITPKEAQVKIISESDIPEGIQPKVFNSKAELDEFIQQINEIEFEASTSLHENTKLIKTRSETGGGAGTKSIETELDSKGEYTIIIDLTYAKKGSGNIAISSKNATTWTFSSWTQDTGVADWMGTSSIQYALTGTIKWYVVVSWEWIEISRQSFSIRGTEQV